jgi:hypothetical protein
MSAQDLTFSELLDVTRAWTEDPAAAFLAASPVSAPFMGRFQSLRALIGGASSTDAEVAQLTDQLGLADADHDEIARFIIAFFAAFAYYDDEAIAQLAQRLAAAIIPDGGMLVRMSYADEAGRVAPRAAVLTAEVRAELATFPLPGSRTLADKVDQLQARATELGTLLERRRALVGGAEGPSGEELLDARRALIALIEQLFQSYRMLAAGLDEAARQQVTALEASWTTAVSEATGRASSRRRARAAPTPAPTDPA